MLNEQIIIQTKNRTLRTLKRTLHFSLGGQGVVPEKCVHGHHNPWRTEPTLGSVGFSYPFLMSIETKNVLDIELSSNLAI